jgi:hypothetical protein
MQDDQVDGSPCFVIRASWWAGEPQDLWIDQKTFLLRRIEESATYSDHRTEETTTFEPVVDEELPESSLVFDPPVFEER